MKTAITWELRDTGNRKIVSRIDYISAVRITSSVFASLQCLHESHHYAMDHISLQFLQG